MQLISIPDLVEIVPGPAKKFRHFAIFIFAREQKCINNHFGMGFCAEMVVTNTFFVLKKFLINVFSLKDFFISSNKGWKGNTDTYHSQHIQHIEAELFYNLKIINSCFDFCL